jgi:hypothetical protein
MCGIYSKQAKAPIHRTVRALFFIKFQGREVDGRVVKESEGVLIVAGAFIKSKLQRSSDDDKDDEDFFPGSDARG